MLHRCPHPPFRQVRQAGGVRRGRLFVVAPALFSGLPAGAAFGQDALEEPAGGFVVPALGTGKLRLGGDQIALAGGLEDAGPVAFQIGLGPFQRGYGGVEPGEVFLDFGDYAVLIG